MTRSTAESAILLDPPSTRALSELVPERLAISSSIGGEVGREHGHDREAKGKPIQEYVFWGEDPVAILRDDFPSTST